MDARLVIRSLIFGVIIAALARTAEARKQYPRQQQRVRRQLDPSRFYAQNFTVGLHSKGLDYGPWGPWTESSSCSRTCGGGIAYQERICMNLRADGVHSCAGSARRYYSCNIQDCPSGSKDFRLEQCAKFNTIPYEGKYYSWYPYEKAQNPCELNCMPRGERFYTRMARKVIDGTRCYNDGSLDACVDGICMPVGCDMVLGSGTKEDKCRVCGGDGSSCRLIQGISDSNDFHVGYNDLLLIPAGATFIHIKEVRATNNYLAVRNLAGKYYLNGNWRIEFPREVKFAGTQFVYERKPQGYLAPESLRARGPTAEPIFIVLLYQEKNLGITYEYSIPEGVNTAKPDTYSWTFGDFEECSQTCGGGTQVRLVQCIRSSDREVLSNDLCDPVLKPVTNGTCNSQPCPARWHIGEWTNCSKPCAIGTQYRIVYCQQLTEKGSSILLLDNMCHEPKPLFMRTCNEDIECPAWYKEPWSECDRSCGLGNQTREISCRNREHGEVLEDFQCSSSAKPAEFQECSLGPCEGVEWIVSDWSGCEGLCSPQMESREAYCSNENGTIFSDEACDPKRIPEMTRPCPESAICEPMWHTSQWTKCSAKCGTGVETRVVFCGVWEDNVVMKVDESKCNSDTKLSEVQNCSHAPCKGVWFQSPWNRCSVPCGGGERIRKILCFQNNSVVSNSHCDPSSRPFEKEMCNMSPCDGDEVMVVGGCKDSKYGCCPDGITAAGLNFEGCPKVTASGNDSCDESEFGCCADGITLALGPFRQGCPSISFCNGTKYGCCPDETTAAQGPENEGCPEPRQCDLSLFGCCPDGISEAEGEEFDGCEMNCTVSEFGCCLDGVTAASGENFTGCEISITSYTDADFSTVEASGEPCTETDFGCCPDGVSIAYSPSMEGCPETYTPSEEPIYKCNNSIYGCCPDNITIAKGPDGEGCDEIEGSGEEIDCLFAIHGCCFDNETASKGPNGEGCPETEDCMNTTFGCCNDNITIATGPEGEGCEETVMNCENTTFGCCPDNKTIATGPEGEGCEESIIDCENTTFGCCPDNKTIATGPEGEGCEESIIDCENTTFGCCPDNTTIATGPEGEGCEESIIDCENTTFGCCPDNKTMATGPEGDGCEESIIDCENTTFGCCPDNTTIATGPEGEGCEESIIDCENTTFGCCPDNKTIATGPEGEGCEESIIECENTTFGCCPDNTTIATGPEGEGCEESIIDCENTTFGCCPDNKTIATGPEGEGCEESIIDCKNTTFGCCPDNTTIATGPEGEGCEESIIDCENTTFGCCPDNKTIATGSEGEGCEESIIDCENTTFGCCPDNITVATGPEDEGCEESIIDCENTTFGCCPDNITVATGPEDEGCEESIIDCENTTFGCCPDNITVATGPEDEGCEESIIDCENTTFGCCPDNITVATGPEDEGCEKFAQTDCALTTFGCCPDNITFASGPNNDGCADGMITSCFNSTFGCCPDNLTFAEGYDNQGCEKIGLTACINTTFGCCPDNLTIAKSSSYEGCNITNCSDSEFGCCPDSISPAFGPDNEGCKDQVPDTTTPETSSTEDLAECVNTVFGCCPDMKTVARGPNLQGCCFGMKFGCCPDNITAALGPNFLGCGCQTYPYGCCPDGITFAQGYGYIGCRCEHYRYGCCQDNYTPAAGPNFDGCYCNRMAFGCCPDGITAATGRDNEGCGCHTARYGCCPDGQTAAQSSDFRDCPCDAQTYGCCPDGRTPAQGSRYEGCPCETGEFGCCSDGVTPAQGPNFNGCPDAKEPEVTTHGAVCHLPKDPGPCRNYTVKWFFDLVYGGCSRFWYGGCEGNGNVFNSQDQCEKVCVAPEGAGVCLLPKVDGPCEGKFPSWYYDAATGTCSKFTYSGCLGNNNRFASKEICEKSCASQKSLDVCEQPRVAGPCRASFPRWYYDQQEKQCKQFVYGGCDGNQNNFETKKECRRRCSALTNKEICILPKAEGHCLDNFPRWYYDYVDKKCKEFTYTGCQGNKNKFISKEKCEKICNSTHVQVSVDVCSLPKEEGPCKETLLRWHYSSSSGRCEQFYYGGCEGNVNRFETRSSCEYACLPVTEKDICHQPQEMGNCYDFRERWFYDYEAGECRRFYFSGCGGNDNNFGSFSECERRCGQSVTTQVAVDEFRIEFCSMPKDPGPCSKKEQLWFYDVADGVCKEFQYGGCHGNGNRFRARKDCERMCGASQDICKLPVVKGSCSSSFVQWYYDHSADECYEFLFTGCHGNANRFNSRENCQNQCKKQIIATPEVPKDDVCTLPEEPGPCQGYYHMWFYDSSDHSCKSFIYGGCDGNENRFETRKACEHKCLKVIREFTTPQPEVTPGSNEDVCRLPVEAGRCNEEHTRWYYDVKTESCLRFVYGGCGGNKNRFKTPDICIRFCTGIQAAVSLDVETPYVPPPVSTTTTTTTTSPSPVCPPSNCEQLLCPYGFDKSYDDQGCTTCQCHNPCKGHICEEGSRCVIEIFRTAEGEPSIRPICRLVNKPGECLTNVQPLLAGSNSDCVDRCRNDADCSGDDKCCHNGCAYVCTKPVEIEEATTPAIAEAPVKILPSPSIVITQLGQPTILYCNAVGFPRPVVTWWRGYTMLPLTSSRYQQATDYSLMIRSVVYEDHGIYECQAYNGVGPVAIWKVRVILESDDTSALPTYDDSNATRGNQVANQDHASNARRDNWIHYGSDDLSSPTENIFAATTSSVDDEDNQFLNVPLSTSVSLITNNPQVESAVQIDCEAQGPSPGTIVTWLFQGIEIQHHDERVQIFANHTLLITRAKVSDSGEYTCTAVHNDNVSSSSVTITVTDEDCFDSPSFANCDLIVKAQYCNNRYYGKYCCASCTKAGQKLPSK